jgi:excisionase family DNA binding protein
MRETPARRRNLSPSEIAERYGVSTNTVSAWIRSGELKALNLAKRTAQLPRYSISPEAIEEFEAARAVVPDHGMSTTQRLRRQAKLGAAKDYFADL